MKSINKKGLFSAISTLTLVAGIAACNGSDSAAVPAATAPGQQPGVATPGTATPGKQIDRLARPAINEGLSVTDASLNAFNSIPPSADLSDAAAPVRTEAVNTLKAFGALGKALGTTPAPAPEVIAGAFLPDVMRIDTRVNAPPGVTAYNAATSGAKGILTGGRKLEDDVMDITLSFLVAGDATGKTVSDNVDYAGVQGNPNQPGHKLLHGQSGRLSGATFPFVTTPN
jgi:hypothetical protein